MTGFPTAGEFDRLMERIVPITRSITGDGVRETLSILQGISPGLSVTEYPSGTQVYDWTIPKEWRIRDAYIADMQGNRLVDFKENGLHVVSYSTSVDQVMTFEELQPHLHTLPNLPEAIPYRTSYYRETWGFCLSQNQLAEFDRNASYQVKIDSEHFDGFLTLAEEVLPGGSGKEYLISSYCCHPWMANDNQSGVAIATFLHRYLKAKKDRKHSYRFVILPETIGAISYLKYNEKAMQQLSGGFVLSCCGGPGRQSYKPTFLGNHEIDKAIQLAFRDAGVEPWLRPFAPDGSDERQYSMPAFRIPVATISKDKYYDYDYYHTSLDNLDFVTGENLLKTFNLYKYAIDILERNEIYVNEMPYCEAQLGKRGLYPQMGGALNQSQGSDDQAQVSVEKQVDAITWALFLADGTNDLIEIAQKSGQDFELLHSAIGKLVDGGLMRLSSSEGLACPA